MREKCYCKEILRRDRIVVHLTGCPESYTIEEYDALPWYKKVLRGNPRRVYQDHIRQTIGRV